MERPKNRRRFPTYLVKKDIQLRGIFYNMIFLLIVALITLVTALSPMWEKMMQSHDIETQFYAARILLNFLKLWTPVMIVVFIIFIVHQLLLTHRACGPLVNFMHTIREMTKGNLTRRTYIRKADYLHEECDEINQMLDGLTGLLSETQSEGELLCARFESIQPLQATKEELENTLHVTKEKVDTFKKTLSNFKVAKNSVSVQP
jgi:methyl-accepting chemotaxis protein